MNNIDKMLNNIIGQKKTTNNKNKVLSNKPNPFNTNINFNWNKKTNSNKLKTNNTILNNFGLTQFGGRNDLDFDGVPNKKDCQPRNTMRQDNKIVEGQKRIFHVAKLDGTVLAYNLTHKEAKTLSRKTPNTYLSNAYLDNKKDCWETNRQDCQESNKENNKYSMQSTEKYKTVYLIQVYLENKWGYLLNSSTDLANQYASIKEVNEAIKDFIETHQNLTRSNFRVTAMKVPVILYNEALGEDYDPIGRTW